jgi:hypothetical protein
VILVFGDHWKRRPLKHRGRFGRATNAIDENGTNGDSVRNREDVANREAILTVM